MSLFTDKVQKYNPRLMQELSLTRVQACGMWGNVGGETGGFTALQEKKPTVAGSKGGYGWEQWTGPRRRKYEAWCKSKNMEPASDEANFQYLVYETKTDEINSLIQLRKTTTIEAATETFMKLNLRPGVPNLSGRISWAKKAYEATEPQSKTDSIVKTTAVVVAGTTGTVVATPIDYWPWIIGAGIVVSVIGILLVYLHHAAAKAKIITKKIPKKGKK